MKQFIILTILALVCASAVYAKELNAVVTFYWPGECGGRFAADGHRLHRGDAAVDFDFIPQGSHVTLVGCNGSMDVVASDCGGSAVIHRVAAHERGYRHAIVIDVWAPSEESARAQEGKLLGSMRGRGLCTAYYGQLHRATVKFPAYTSAPLASYSSKRTQRQLLAPVSDAPIMVADANWSEIPRRVRLQTES